jgi:CubicO group peptidase (beta-lactamase class C family)
MEITYWVWTEKMGYGKAFVVFRQGQLISLWKIVSQQRWEGNQIVSRAWVEQSTHTDPSNSRHYYNNNWGIGPLKYNSFYAVGLYGQYLYLYPEKNIQIIRFGDSSLSYNKTGKIFYSNY